MDQLALPEPLEPEHLRVQLERCRLHVRALELGSRLNTPGPSLPDTIVAGPNPNRAWIWTVVEDFGFRRRIQRRDDVAADAAAATAMAMGKRAPTVEGCFGVGFK